MATLAPASDANKQIVTLERLQVITDSLGVRLREEHLQEWHSLLASVQQSIDVVESLPDYLPKVDEVKYPRQNVHRPAPDDNPENAWAWKATIEGAKDGPLQGMRVCLKDNIAAKGVPMLFGTDMFTGYVPDVDATVVTRLLDAGATITGKAVCENLSLCASSFSAATGPVENPWAHGHAAGGSSSGCGSLVGGHYVEAAIGGDQGGSIRFPSSHCGCVGMKPTHGLVPWTGMATHSPIHDTAGPMTANVASNARILKAIAGRDGIDDRGVGVPLPSETPDYENVIGLGVKGLKIGIVKEGFDFQIIDPRVRDTVLDAARRFEQLGAQVVEISIPLHKLAGDINACGLRPASAMHGYLGRASGRRNLYLNGLVEKMTPLTQDKFDKMFSASKFALLSGLYIWEHHPLLYGKAMNLYRQLQHVYDDALTKLDVLVMPTMPYVSPPHAVAEAGPLEQMTKSAGCAINTGPFNASGHPAMSLPVKLLPSEKTGVFLPVGMQIVGRWFDEATIYRVGAAWENAFDWTEGRKAPAWK